jgi:hypothetical protein
VGQKLDSLRCPSSFLVLVGWGVRLPTGFRLGLGLISIDLRQFPSIDNAAFERLGEEDGW